MVGYKDHEVVATPPRRRRDQSIKLQKCERSADALSPAIISLAIASHVDAEAFKVSAPQTQCLCGRDTQPRHLERMRPRYRRLFRQERHHLGKRAVAFQAGVE